VGRQGSRVGAVRQSNGLSSASWGIKIGGTAHVVNVRHRTDGDIQSCCFFLKILEKNLAATWCGCSGGGGGGGGLRGLGLGRGWRSSQSSPVWLVWSGRVAGCRQELRRNSQVALFISRGGRAA
jgi:hypothetical protein